MLHRVHRGLRNLTSKPTALSDPPCWLHLHVAGKPNGQAFVLLPKAESLKAQVELNNKYMGKRFIECVGL